MPLPIPRCRFHVGIWTCPTGVGYNHAVTQSSQRAFCSLRLPHVLTMPDLSKLHAPLPPRYLWKGGRANAVNPNQMTGLE